MLNTEQQTAGENGMLNSRNPLPLSPQWILTYYKALSKAWNDETFKLALLQNSNEALHKEFKFEVPSNIKVEFQEVQNNNFSDFPLKSVSLFDSVQKSQVVFKVPLPPAPPSMENTLDYVISLAKKPTITECCCFCC
jgi:ribosomally synthesized peptide (two-chain TOMM family)